MSVLLPNQSTTRGEGHRFNSCILSNSLASISGKKTWWVYQHHKTIRILLLCRKGLIHRGKKMISNLVSSQTYTNVNFKLNLHLWNDQKNVAGPLIMIYSFWVQVFWCRARFCIVWSVLNIILTSTIKKQKDVAEPTLSRRDLQPRVLIKLVHGGSGECRSTNLRWILGDRAGLDSFRVFASKTVQGNGPPDTSQRQEIQSDEQWSKSRMGTPSTPATLIGVKT